MANPRDVTYDIVAYDKSDRGTRKAADNLDRLKRKADAANTSMTKGSDKTEKRLKVMVGKAKAAALALGKLTSAVGAVGSALPLAALGMVKLTTATARWLAGVAPALATLPALAAGAALVVGTLKLAGPAMVAGVKPITQAFTDLQGRIGAVAAKGLPDLARGFVKANMPTIAKGMERIAAAANLTARNVLRWTQTRPGMRAISDIVKATAGFTERLAPLASGVASSFAALAGRAAEPAFRGLGGVLGEAADAAKRWADGITRQDVQNALRDISGLAQNVRDKFLMLRDIGRWMLENEEAVRRFSTALAGIGLAVGIATGGWLLALGAGLTLLAANWDKVKAAGERTSKWLRRFVDENPQVQATIDKAKGAVSDLRAGWEAFVDRVKPKVGPFLTQLKELFIALQPYIQAGIELWGKYGKSALTTAGKVASAALTMATKIAEFATSFMRNLTLGILGAKLFAAQMKSQMLKAAVSVGEFASKSVGIMAQLPGWLGEPARKAAGRVDAELAKLRGSANRTESEVRKIQSAINSLKSKTVKLTVQQVFQKYGQESAIARQKYGAAGLAATPPGQGRWARFMDGQSSRTAPVVEVKAGATNVDTRVFLDSREIRAVARSTVLQEQDAAAWRARVGRRR